MKLFFKPGRVLKLGVGKLTFEYGYDNIALTTYDGGGPRAYRIIYSDGKLECVFSSLVELGAFAKLHSIPIESEVSAHIKDWARVLIGIHEMSQMSQGAKTHNIGHTSIIEDTPIHKENYASRGVFYEDVKPYIRQGKLAWHSIKRGNDFSSLMEFQCNLDTFEITSSFVRKLNSPQS